VILATGNLTKHHSHSDQPYFSHDTKEAGDAKKEIKEPGLSEYSICAAVDVAFRCIT